MIPHDYAARVDTGTGSPILVCAGGLTNSINDHSVYWEYLSLFTIWQYVDGRAVQFQPADANMMGIAITSSGVWFGWDGSTEPHYEVHKVNAGLYPFQNGGISAQAADTLYGSFESFQLNGVSVNQQEFEARLADLSSDICVISGVSGAPTGGFSGVSPAEQILDALLVLGGF